MADVASSPARADDTPRAAAGVPEDVADHALVQLLAADIDRLNIVTSNQKMTNEMQSRDEQRMQIMLKLAQEQVTRSKESYGRVTTRLDESERRTKELVSSNDGLERKAALLEDELKAQKLRATRAADDMAAQLTAKELDGSATADSLGRVRAELSSAKATAVVAGDEAEKKSRALFEQLVAVQARLQTAEDEGAFTQEMRHKDTKAVAEREFGLNKTVASLKQRLADADAALDRDRKTSFEAMTTVRGDSEQLRVRLLQMEGMVKVSDHDNFAKIERLTLEAQMAKDRAEKEFFAAQAREKVLEHQTARLTADLRVAQSEINELCDKEQGSRQGSINSIVELSAARDALQVRVRTLEEQLAGQTSDARLNAVALRTDADVARREKVEADRRPAAALAVAADENTRLKEDLHALTRTVATAASDAAAYEAASEATAGDQAKTIAALNIEVVGYKETVGKLDKHLRENYTVKLLEDEVASLKKQTVHLKNQLTHTNSVVANLRVEADILENSRMVLMQEQTAETQRKMMNAERELRFARPLISDLVELAQRATMDTALERDIDMFYRNFGNK
jgi:hypothetical protein